MTDHRGRFDENELIAAARSVDGLDDLGAEPFREPLRVLLASLAAAPLSESGAKILSRSIAHGLARRMRMTYWLDRFPEIESEKIEAPLVVVGMMRSGTTLMHRILAADPRHDCTLGWEAREPMPRLDVDWGRPDPRIADAEKADALAAQFVPELLAIHPSSAHQAEEEIVFLADAFLSHVPEAYCDVPAYRGWLDQQDFTPAYRHLRRTLQILQWQKRKRAPRRDRWVLKSPAHLGYLDTLLKTFPDAHVVFTHRDPVDTVPSGARLNAALWRLHQDEVDPARVGAQWIERMAWAVRRAMAVRDEGVVAADRCTDVRYRDAVADPLAQVERVYDALGLRLTGDAARAMRGWLAESRQHHRPPDYSARDFGLSEDRIRAEFRPYVERYLTPNETA